jgi:hypothetical protein
MEISRGQCPQNKPQQDIPPCEGRRMFYRNLSRRSSAKTEVQRKRVGKCFGAVIASIQ